MMAMHWILFIPLLTGLMALLTSNAILLFMRRNAHGLLSYELSLLDIIRDTSAQVLSRQRKHFMLIVGIQLLVVVCIKYLAQEYHSLLLPMGIGVGLLMAMGCEWVLALIWNSSLPFALSRLKESASSAQKTSLWVGFSSALAVVGLLLVGLWVWLGWVGWVMDAHHTALFDQMVPIRLFANLHQTIPFRTLEAILAVLAPCFSSCLYAFFSRINTGIFAKSADLSADITGRTEFDLPEDDLRNPVVISDLAGDMLNMKSIISSLFQTTLFALCLSGALGILQFISLSDHQWHHIAHVLVQPLLLLSFGTLSAILLLPLLSVRVIVEKAGLFIPLTGILTLVIGTALTPHMMPIRLGIGCALLILIGLGVWTLPAISPAIRRLVAAHRVHAVNGILSGFLYAALGLIPPVLGLAILFYEVAHYFTISHTMLLGVLKLGLATCSILSLFVPVVMLGVYGTFSDLLKGFSEILTLPDESRDAMTKIDMNASLGGTLIKGFLLTCGPAIGIQFIALLLYRVYFFQLFHAGFFIPNVTLHHLILFFDLMLIRPLAWEGIVIGGVSCFLLMTGLIWGVQRTSQLMTEITRRQLSEGDGIWSGDTLPDYNEVVKKATTLSLRFTKWILLFVFILPLFMVLRFKILGSVGLIIGVSMTAFTLGHFFNILGSLWKGTKKKIEAESGIQSTEHVAAVFSDSLGDVLKDTLAPSFALFANLLGFILILAISLIFK